MKTVCVITGGGSGMGLAAAKCMPKEKIIVVTALYNFSFFENHYSICISDR